jgi:catechol 2,3-dioxygenase-like lactoylglutathione lyase family enzyme
MATDRVPEDCRMTRSACYFLVDDVFATAEFYRDVLGFTFDGFFGVPPAFVIVERDDVSIMFRQVQPPGKPVARSNSTVMNDTFDAYVYVSNVDQLAAELRARQADIVEGPVDRIYDMRELLVRDCNGYIIAFGQG